MAINVCPCMPLQKGCVLLAIIDAVISFINLCLLILAFVGVIVLTNEEKLNLDRRERNIALGVIAIAMVISFLQILMAFRLYFGAKNRDRKNIKIWLIVSTITVLINIVSLLIESSAGEANGIYIGGTLNPRSRHGTGINEAVNSTPIPLATISQPGIYQSSPHAQHHVYATQQLGPVASNATTDNHPREPIITFQSSGEVGWRQ